MAQLLNRMVDLDEIFCGRYDIEGDLDSILLIPVASAIPICLDCLCSILTVATMLFTVSVCRECRCIFYSRNFFSFR
jgi:hypothetical protein